MKVICNHCLLKGHQIPVSLDMIQSRDGVLVMAGRCIDCGQGYYKIPPEDIEVK